MSKQLVAGAGVNEKMAIGELDHDMDQLVSGDEIEASPLVLVSPEEGWSRFFALPPLCQW